MAKKSMIAREKKRAQVAAKNDAKRDALKAVIKNPNSSFEEIEEATLKLQTVAA